MRRNVITASDLRAMGACHASIRWMLRTYPAGAPVNAETLATVPNKRWLIWLASKRHPELRFTWAGMVFRHGSRHYPSLAEFADKVTADNCLQAKETAKAVLDEARANGAPDADFYLADYAVRVAVCCDTASCAAEVAGYAAASAGYEAYFAAYENYGAEAEAAHSHNADYDDVYANNRVYIEAREAESRAVSAAWSEMADISVKYLLQKK